MRLLTFRMHGGTRAGRVEGDRVVELGFADVGAVLAAGAADAVRFATGPEHPLVGLQLAPPVVDPSKIICVGHNYLAHIKERAAKIPPHPPLFNKFRRTLIGPRDPITLPRVSEQADWEVELTLVIGTPARHVSGASAEEAIFGYTIMNDTSIRDWQYHSPGVMPGKAFEGSTPVGPMVVSRDELDASNLRLWTEVNGQIMQDSNTSDLLFKPAEIVAYCSAFITLDPGDLIATGTPSGVGVARDPQVWLRSGDTVRCGIDGIGELINRCIREP